MIDFKFNKLIQKSTASAHQSMTGCALYASIATCSAMRLIIPDMPATERLSWRFTRHHQAND
jgi:hypothetical protein